MIKALESKTPARLQISLTNLAFDFHCPRWLPNPFNGLFGFFPILRGSLGDGARLTAPGDKSIPGEVRILISFSFIKQVLCCLF
jgi:hypothetical protein